MSYYYSDFNKFLDTYESRIHIDWLTLTFKRSNNLTSDDLELLKEGVKAFLFLDDVDDRENVNQRIYVQYNGYTGYFARNVRLAESYDDFGELQGFMLDITGTGLKSLEYHLQHKVIAVTNNPNYHIYTQIKGLLLKYKGLYRVTRLDLANDLFDAPVELTPAYIYYWVKYCDGFRGKSKFVDYEHSGQMGIYNHTVTPVNSQAVIEQLSDSESEGTTVYIGKSPHRIRIYNKKAEQAMKNNPINDNYCNWIRWELELRADYSTKFVYYWLSDCKEDLITAYYGWLGQRFQFINNDGSQTHRTRYDITDWYTAFIDFNNGYPKLPTLANPQPKSTLYRKLNWYANGGGKVAIDEIKEALKARFTLDYGGYYTETQINEMVNNEFDNITDSLKRTGKEITDRDLLEKRLRVNDYYNEFDNQLKHDNCDYKPIQNNTKSDNFDDNINPFI